VVLERKEVTYSYFAEPMYVFMDGEYNQYEVEAENMGDALNYVEDGMACDVVFLQRQGDLRRVAQLPDPRGSSTPSRRTRDTSRQW